MAAILDIDAALCLLAKTLGKWVLSVRPYGWFDSGRSLGAWVHPAAPYIDALAHCQILADEWGVVVCDSEDEVERYFDLTVGDDGPTEANPYDGPDRVYAIVIDPQGELCHENT